MRILLLALAVALAVCASALADDISEEDWNRWHDRQDACVELSQVQLACIQGGLAACDELAIKRLQRQCSAFGPTRRR